MKYLFRHICAVEKEILRAERVYIMLDYDGTLTPIVSHPRKAILGNQTRQVLSSLIARSRCVLAIVSGRSLKEVKRLVRVNGAYYLGNHGMEISGPGLSFVHPRAARLSETLTHVAKVLRERLGDIEGVLVENKGLSLSIHYRMVAPKNVPKIKGLFHDIIGRYSHLKVTYGKMVLEARVRVLWDKGRAVDWLMESLGRGLPVYIGDDQTDEDAFLRLKDGITVLVTRRWRPSKSKYYVKDTWEVCRFLQLLQPLLLSQSFSR